MIRWQPAMPRGPAHAVDVGGGAAPLGGLLAGTGRLAVLPLGRLAWLPVTAAGPPGLPPALALHEPVLLIRATAGPAAARLGCSRVPNGRGVQ